jgi:hypothetical protein
VEKNEYRRIPPQSMVGHGWTFWPSDCQCVLQLHGCEAAHRFHFFNSKLQFVSACAGSDLDFGSDYRAVYPQFCAQSFVKNENAGIQKSVATRLRCSKCSSSISIFFTCQFAGSSPPTFLCQIENVVKQAVIQTERAETKQKSKNCPQKSNHLKQDLNVFTKT